MIAIEIANTGTTSVPAEIRYVMTQPRSPGIERSETVLVPRSSVRALQSMPQAGPYAFLTALAPPDPDPAVLLVTFSIHRDGKFVLRSLREMPQGRADHGSDEGEYSVSSLDEEGGLIERIGFSLDFDKLWSHKPMNAAPVAFMLAYPPNAARVEVRRGEAILGSFDTHATSLRKLIEAIPDRGFSKNSKQRRDALLSKVDAFEKMLAAREYSNARNKLTSDIRKHVEMWTLDFDQGLLSESTKSDVLAQIDRIDARLAVQVAKKPAKAQ